MDPSKLIVRNIVFDANNTDGAWDSIVMSAAEKDRLLRSALLSFVLRAKLSFTTTAIHGLAILTGPPGTGKTTLARGLAAQIAKVTETGSARLIEIDPHGLMSGEHGQTQQRVQRLLVEYVPELADDGIPTVVLLDEVESMAVARSSASLSANPVDVHRATDAVLTALDNNAQTSGNLFTVATTNFPDAVDEAFSSRADIVINMPKPDKASIESILRQTLAAFGADFPHLTELANDPEIPNVAIALDGRDGREVRKLVTQAMLERFETTVNPDELAISDLLDAARHA